jgi:Icc-related predicted phosphoesterase
MLEITDFLEWYQKIPVKYKLFVAGNHDTAIARKKIEYSDMILRDIIYLENESIEIEGIKIWGSPITPTFGDWSFMKARDKTHEVWKTIPDDTDILVVHGPPKGVRDLSIDRDGKLEMCGDRALMKRCWELRHTLKYMCFGHIHNCKEIDTNQGMSTYSNTRTKFSNAACVLDGRFDMGLTSFGNTFEIH